MRVMSKKVVRRLIVLALLVVTTEVTAMSDAAFSKIINNYFQNDYRERDKVKWNGYFLSDHTFISQP